MPQAIRLPNSSIILLFHRSGFSPLGLPLPALPIVINTRDLFIFLAYICAIRNSCLVRIIFVRVILLRAPP